MVILSFTQTLAVDYAITLDLSAAGGYRLAAKVRSGQTVFYVWEYTCQSDPEPRPAVRGP